MPTRDRPRAARAPRGERGSPSGRRGAPGERGVRRGALGADDVPDVLVGLWVLGEVKVALVELPVGTIRRQTP